MLTRTFLLVLAGAAVVAAQQTPAPPPAGARRDPGFFKGDKKKGGDENSRAVAGVVHNGQEDPVENAIVQLKDTKTKQVRSFITKADGRYYFHGLSANVDYELRAAFKELASDNKTLSIFDNRKEAVINLKVEKKEKEKEKTNP